MEQRIDTKKLLLYTVGTLALSIILIAVRLYLLLSYFDPDAQQYVMNVASPLYFNAALCVAVLILFSAFFVFRKKSAAVDFASPTQATVFTASLCAFMMIAYIILEIYAQYTTHFSFISYFQEFAKYEQKCRQFIFKFALCCWPFRVFFISSVLLPLRTKTKNGLAFSRFSRFCGS